MFPSDTTERTQDCKKVLGLDGEGTRSSIWWERILLFEKGMDWDKTATKDPLERACIAYSLAHSNDCKINWDTGEITPPK